MRSVVMIVADVFAHQTLQMPFVYYDDMIQQVVPRQNSIWDEKRGV
jgi:hypothetical protein